MEGLGEFLGQDQTARAILEAFRSPHTPLVRLTGPSGSGKSHVALSVGATWRDFGGKCVIALGDGNHSSRSRYPFLSGLSFVPPGWASVANAGSRSALQVAEVMAGSGGAATSIFDLLTSTFRQRVERALRPYCGVEREIILDLKRLARARPLLLIAENAHWWDADSLWLLREILSDPLRTAVPQLSSIVVLLVDTADEQQPSAPEFFDPLIAMCSALTWNVSRCTRQQFPRVLHILGLSQELPEGILHALYSATDGHLKLAEQFAAYAEYHGLSELLSPKDTDYLASLLSARIATLGTSREAIMTLLIRAAVIGLSFEEKELLCLMEGSEDQLGQLIDRAASISLLSREAGRLSFSHDVIRSAILRNQPQSVVRAHLKKFEKCLSILRPGDYAARYAILLQAGETERARELLALTAVDQLRRGGSASRVLRGTAAQFPDDTALYAFIEIMATAYASIGTGEFARALPLLQAPISRETLLMAAERHYLLALCSIELQTAAGFEEAQRILLSWQQALRAEPELNLRVLLLLQQAQVHSDRFEEARETERTIERRLLARAEFDPDAAVLMQIQNRRAGALNAPEVAEHRIREAVAFFRRGTGDLTRDRLELFRSLNNLAAIEIRLGKDQAAYATTRECERVVVDAPEMIPRLDVLASNAVLAGMRSRSITIADAVERQRLIIESPEGGKDKFLHRCNLVAYMLLSRQDSDALDELGRLREELRRDELIESYLVYYWHVLDVAATVLSGDLERARERHARLEPYVRALKWPSAPYIRRRQVLLGSLLPTISPGQERASADTCILSVRLSEIGPAWSYYARLMPCCELSFWSDS